MQCHPLFLLPFFSVTLLHTQIIMKFLFFFLIVFCECCRAAISFVRFVEQFRASSPIPLPKKTIRPVQRACATTPNRSSSATPPSSPKPTALDLVDWSPVTQQSSPDSVHIPSGSTSWLGTPPPSVVQYPTVEPDFDCTFSTITLRTATSGSSSGVEILEENRNSNEHRNSDQKRKKINKKIQEAAKGLANNIKGLVNKTRNIRVPKVFNRRVVKPKRFFATGTVGDLTDLLLEKLYFCDPCAEIGQASRSHVLRSPLVEVIVITVRREESCVSLTLRPMPFSGRTLITVRWGSGPDEEMTPAEVGILITLRGLSQC